MYGYFLAILSLYVLFPVITIAQTGKIEGWLKDNESKAPLTGASINLNTATESTEADGSFQFNNLAAGNYELVISHIGYKSELIPVDVKPNTVSSLNIYLKPAGLNLAEVRINSKKNNNTLAQVDILLRPVNSAQDLLRVVPGLVIAQHAGGGKAEQIFLRGFDLDHGTDISLSVDGMPVNMVSHAHGQGYADLHFLIPETIEKIDFETGPYQVNRGNLATAGYVDFHTKTFLTDNLFKVEAGCFGTNKMTGLFKLMNKDREGKKEQVYAATEYLQQDGYFDLPQDLHRLNLMLKYSSQWGNKNTFAVTATGFDSRWKASGQVPLRAVNKGIISRYGSIDDYEGGSTSRYNLNIKHSYNFRNNWKTSNQFYFSRYNFNLYSNFTFYLIDSIHGDGIRQKEARNLYGYTGQLSKKWMFGKARGITAFGAGFRQDGIKNIGLSHVEKRMFLSDLQKGDIKETNAFVYLDQQVEVNQKFSIGVGVRFDYFRFRYRDLLSGVNIFASRSKTVLSPKRLINYTLSSSLKIFLNTGVGFHSNDTRVIQQRNANDILPKVYGTDLGIVFKPVKQLILKTVFWHLFSEQEFIYVGDAGIIEAGGKSRRLGADISIRYQVNNWLYADVDYSRAKAREIEANKAADRIPLAPTKVISAGITAKLKNGVQASLKSRYLGDRAANADNSVIAEGYFLTDAVINYRLKQFIFSASIENIFNREWNEAQFETESRLFNEPSPITEIHFTPGSPRFIKIGVSISF